jgi:hypothetical protein
MEEEPSSSTQKKKKRQKDKMRQKSELIRAAPYKKLRNGTQNTQN